MLNKIGEKFTDIFRNNMPDAFVFALVLTIITAVSAYFVADASVLKIGESWYEGFWLMLEFGMQMVLLIITGYSIALSPIAEKGIDAMASVIKTPRQVYFVVVLIGVLLGMISWGWLVITAILARELALRVEGIHYPFLIACVYFSGGSWVLGLSSSIPLLLNTEGNFLIEAGILSDIIPTSFTLGSGLNMAMMILFIVVAPLLSIWLIPKIKAPKQLKDLLQESNTPLQKKNIKEEALELNLPYKALSDQLNNSMILLWLVAIPGLAYIIYYFSTKGLDLNLNIMIFTFLILGLLLHSTPNRYSISMKRASGNISSILFQFPFYAGIMGMMIYTGLGGQLAGWLASVADLDTFPFYAYMAGGLVNFAIPSAGGEFAVIGPSIMGAIHELGANLPADELTAIIARASMSIAYGESLTNLIQPFYLLLIIPVMGTGIKTQARDVMGYLVVPFVLFFIIEVALIMLWPI